MSSHEIHEKNRPRKSGATVHVHVIIVLLPGPTCSDQLCTSEIPLPTVIK